MRKTGVDRRGTIRKLEERKGKNQGSFPRTRTHERIHRKKDPVHRPRAATNEIILNVHIIERTNILFLPKGL